MAIGRHLSKTIPPLILLTLLVHSSGCTSLMGIIGIDVGEIKTGLFDIATALGALMISINGIRWIISSQPEERNEYKKSIMYIMIALILASSAAEIVDAVYKSNIVLD